VIFSLNEVEAMGRRAARGAGLNWGHAEEAGKAARWIAAHGLPGAELLAELLSRNEGLSHHDVAPAATDGIWQAPGGRLCPLITGAALSDRAGEIASGHAFELGATSFPLLLVPYAAAIARATGTAVELTWEGARLVVTPKGGLAAEGDGVAARDAERMTCRGANSPSAAAPAGIAHPDVDGSAWQRLVAFAQITYAQATESSRLAGAGAGITDND